MSDKNKTLIENHEPKLAEIRSNQKTFGITAAEVIMIVLVLLQIALQIAASFWG